MANMELPICEGTYSNDCDASEVKFLNYVMKTVNQYLQYHRSFFAGLCYFCNDGWSPINSLHRCEGCQLVSYCSRECQTHDWASHEHVCNEFPVVDGNNALYTTRPWKEHIAGLRERAAQLPDADIYAKPIFRNPRVCNTCRKAPSDRLIDCECACVSYCSKTCTRADKQHQRDCDQLGFIATYYGLWYDQDLKLDLRNVTMCTKFKPIASYADVFPKRYAIALHVLAEQQHYAMHGMNIELVLSQERLMNPMSLLYALQKLPERRLGQNQRRLENLTSLTVHAVYSSPIFDSEPWEAFMHRLQKLKQLNVVFIIQGKPLKPSFFNLNAELSLQRCKDCKYQGRIITYSVQQMHYHMFFSSQEYTEPDVVVIYGNAKEMLVREEVEIHSVISYRNMICNPSTILVLMDETNELVNQGINAVNMEQPVVQIVSPQVNPFKGSYSDRSELDITAITAENCYFTCLRRKIC